MISDEEGIFNACLSECQTLAVVNDLFTQKDLPLWAVSNSPTIIAISTNTVESHGWRGKVACAILDLLGTSFLGLIFLHLAAFVQITRWWLHSLFFKENRPNQIDLFIGFGAGSEKELLRRFKLETQAYAYLNQTRPESFASIYRPRYFHLFLQSWQEAIKVIRGLRNAVHPVVKGNKSAWLVSSSKRIGTYVFFSVWALEFRFNLRRVVFISSDVPSFAFLDVRDLCADYIVEYWQHGLIRRSLIFPRFDKVHSLTLREAKHIEAMVGYNIVEIDNKRDTPDPENKSPILLFASTYDGWGFNRRDQVDQLRELFEFSLAQGLKVIVRPHPREDTSFWKEYFPSFQVEENVISFDEALKNVSPKIVASWFSTALIDSLKAGILPLLITRGSLFTISDMVFNFEDTVMQWPSDVLDIATALQSNGYYKQKIAVLQTNCFGNTSAATSQSIQ